MTQLASPIWKQLAGLAVPVWLSTASAGDLGPSGWDEAAIERRDWAARWLPVPTRPDRDSLLVCRQVHSLRIAVVLSDQAPYIYEGRFDSAESLQLTSHPLAGDPQSPAGLCGGLEADGVLTDRPGLFAGVTVADCLPILLHGQRSGRPFVAALHSGWGGTGILAVALSALAALQAESPSILLGPCIAAAAYAVPPERAALFARRFGPTAVRPCPDGQPGLDLAAANVAIAAGTAPCLPQGFPRDWAAASTMVTAHQDTFSSPELHSYRREGAENYGRMLAMIGPCPTGRPV